MLTIKLFVDNPDVMEEYRIKFRYILVDEYQDTNHAQYMLVNLLGELPNLCVVGDDDQSIYSFRGADIRNILNSKKTSATRRSSSWSRITVPPALYSMPPTT